MYRKYCFLHLRWVQKALCTWLQRVKATWQYRRLHLVSRIKRVLAVTKNEHTATICQHGNYIKGLTIETPFSELK